MRSTLFIESAKLRTHRAVAVAADLVSNLVSHYSAIGDTIRVTPPIAR